MQKTDVSLSSAYRHAPDFLRSTTDLVSKSQYILSVIATTDQPQQRFNVVVKVFDVAIVV